MEIWKSIDGYDGYEVSSYGNVRSLERMAWNGKSWHKLKGRDLKLLSDGVYMKVSLSKDNKVNSFRVHNLVANSFLKKPTIIGKLEVDHIDGNKLNNNLNNLQYITQRENTIKGISRSKTSKYTGVCWRKDRNKWLASVNMKDFKKQKSFIDEEQAHLWYEEKIKEYYEQK